MGPVIDKKVEHEKMCKSTNQIITYYSIIINNLLKIIVNEQCLDA